MSRRADGLAAAVLALLGLALGAILLRGLMEMPRPVEGIAPLVRARLDEAGVENEVTAVLLNFRAHDTLLEVSVLLLAAVSVFLLRPIEGESPVAMEPISEGPYQTEMLRWYVRRLIPVGLVLSAYLWWAGSHEPGGAFQAGAVLAGTLTLALLSGVRPPPSRLLIVRVAVAVGPVGFALAALLPALGRLSFLEYPEGFETPLILAIEALLTVSIAVGLTELMVGVPPRRAR